MFCTQCGTRNTGTSNFCSECGHRLRNESTAAEATTARPQDVEKLLAQAYSLKDAGQMEQALELCRMALRLDPENISGRSLLADIYERTGNLDAAIRQMERVYQMSGDPVDEIRLDNLRAQARELYPETYPASPWESARVVALQLLRRRDVVVGAVAGLLIIIIVVALPKPPQVRDSISQSNGQSTQQAATGEPLFPERQPAATQPLFDSPDQGQEEERAVTETAARTTPQRDNQSPSGAAPTSLGQQAPATSGTPAAVTRTGQPEPAAPAPPTPRINITRSNSPANPPAASNTAAERPSTERRQLSGRDLQKMALDAQEEGNKSQAIDLYRQAIDAYRKEAGSDGQGFTAQQGIRSCQLALQLLESGA